MMHGVGLARIRPAILWCTELSSSGCCARSLRHADTALCRCTAQKNASLPRPPSCLPFYWLNIMNKQLKSMLNKLYIESRTHSDHGKHKLKTFSAEDFLQMTSMISQLASFSCCPQVSAVCTVQVTLRVRFEFDRFKEGNQDFEFGFLELY